MLAAEIEVYLNNERDLKTRINKLIWGLGDDLHNGKRKKYLDIYYLKNITSILKKNDSFIIPEVCINNFTAQSLKILLQAYNAGVIREMHNKIARAKYFQYLGVATESFIIRNGLGEFK